MSLYDRLVTIFGTWDTGVTPKPLCFNVRKKDMAHGVYQIGIDEGFAPMPTAGLGSNPTHDRTWDFRCELLTESTEAQLEKMIEEASKLLEAAALTSGMYTVDSIGKKTERYGMKCIDLYGVELQLIKPGSAF